MSSRVQPNNRRGGRLQPVRLVVIIIVASKLDQKTLCTLGYVALAALTLPAIDRVDGAIASFLQRPKDLASQQNVGRLEGTTATWNSEDQDVTRNGGFRDYSTYWISTPVSARSYAFLLLYVVEETRGSTSRQMSNRSFVTLDAAGILLNHAIRDLKSQGLPPDNNAFWSYGFGQVSAFALINLYKSNSNLMYLILFANLPQGLLSVLYLLYNSMLTCMLMEREFQDYARHRKHLRVSSPLDGQSQASISSSLSDTRFLSSCFQD